jgi:phosphate transport system substrate-binding protein
MGLVLGLLGLVGAAAFAGTQTVVVPGAGPSTWIVTEFFTRFADKDAARGYTFEVPSRSIKHSGGLRATADHLFGRTGRPLTAAEAGTTRAEIPLARIPLAFVCDPACGVETISRDDLVRLLDGRIGNWRELGGAHLKVRLVGREPGEAARRALEAEIPELADARFDLVLRKDHQLVELLQTRDRAGVLAFGAAPNFTADQLLTVEGLAVGLAVGLVYDLRNADHPLVVAARQFSRSAEWARLVSELGYLPPAPPS